MTDRPKDNTGYDLPKIKQLISIMHEPPLNIYDPYVKPSFCNAFNEIPTKTSDTTYLDFFENHLLKNVPCVLKNVTQNWACKNQWIKDGNINYDYLRSTYGNSQVPVADCETQYFNSHEKREMKCSEYIDYLEDKNRTGLLYLKDWHCRKHYPDDKFYEVPIYFSQDWLNEYAIATKTDDFMFVYIGAANTWTPFHADVYNSYSWSVNVIGKKKWRLYPPKMEKLMTDKHGNLPFDCTSVSHPEQCKYFTIIQEQGDAIFVPSGWYHQVWNLEDTISINHNWVNGCNIHILWKTLKEEIRKVEQEISDCKEMEDWHYQCQVILRANFGMNYYDFYNLIIVIASRRISRLKQSDISCFGFLLGAKYAVFDLQRIKDILVEFLNNDTVVHVVKQTYRLKLIELLRNIDECVVEWEKWLQERVKLKT